MQPPHGMTPSKGGGGGREDIFMVARGASCAVDDVKPSLSHPYLALRDTLSSWEAYGMRNKRRKENNGGHKSRNNGYHTKRSGPCRLACRAYVVLTCSPRPSHPHRRRHATVHTAGGRLLRDGSKGATCGQGQWARAELCRQGHCNILRSGQAVLHHQAVGVVEAAQTGTGTGGTKKCPTQSH